MSILNGKQKYWILGACAGVLVLAGGLCAILLSGKESTLSRTLQGNAVAPPSQAAATLSQANIVVGTPEVDPVVEQHKREIEAIVIRDTMLPGTRIYGVDVSGMSREEALSAVTQKLTDEPLTINLLLFDGTNIYPTSAEGIQALSAKAAEPQEDDDDDAVDPDMVKAEAEGDPDPNDDPGDPADKGPVGIQLQFDINNAVNTAFSLMRDTSVPYEDFMLQVTEIAAGKDVAPAPSYDTESVDRYVGYLADLLDTPAVNATITMDGNQLVYTDEAVGKGIDRAALTATILSTDPLSGETIDIPMQVLEPTVTKELLQSKYVKRGKGYTTSFSGSTKNRKYNIRFGAEKINGTILKPGEVFSTNETLGKRTRANGWKNAGAYEAGEVVQQAGGGVCQLSSTLYNAVLLADLKIVERRNHSMPVSYVSRGRDATINSVGNIIDFKFENNTSGDIIIVAYTSGNTLTMEIYGIPFETDEYDRIEIRTKNAGSTPIKTIYTYIDTKPTTYSKVISKGSKGSKVRTFKDYYKGNQLVRSEDLGLSVYTMFPKKVEVGTIEVTPPPSPPSDDGGE